jgi:hypothetical protein
MKVTGTDSYGDTWNGARIEIDNLLYMGPPEGITVPVESCYQRTDTLTYLPQITVLIQLDISSVPDWSLPGISGEFCNWCNPAPLTISNGVGTFSLTLNADDEIEYKFANDGWSADETLESGLPCTITSGGFTNRIISFDGYTVRTGTALNPYELFLPENNQVQLPVVCAGMCTSCSPPSPSPTLLSFANSLVGEIAGQVITIPPEDFYPFSLWSNGSITFIDGNQQIKLLTATDAANPLLFECSCGTDASYTVVLDGYGSISFNSVRVQLSTASTFSSSLVTVYATGLTGTLGVLFSENTWVTAGELIPTTPPTRKLK